MQLYFIKFHYVITSASRTMKSFTSLCLLSEKIQEIRKPVLHHLQTPDTRTIDSFIKKIFRGQSSFSQRFLKQVVVSRQQLPIPPRKPDEHHPLRRSPRSPPGARQQHLTRRISTKTLDGDTLVFWGKGSDFGVRGNSPAHPTEVLHFFLPHTPYMEGGSDPLEQSSPLKIKRLETRSSAPIEAGHKAIASDGGALSRWLISSRWLTCHAKQTPKQREIDHHLLHLSFLYLMKRRRAHGNLTDNGTRAQKQVFRGNGRGYFYTKNQTNL